MSAAVEMKWESIPMTEAEWLTGTSLRRLLPEAGLHCGERKLRLFAVACCRRVAPLIADGRAQAALLFADQMAERGPAGRRGRPAVYKAARRACEDLWESDTSALDAAGLLAHLARSNATHAACESVIADALTAATNTHSAAYLAMAYTRCKVPRAKDAFPPDRGVHIDGEEKEQVRLLRDIAGNPFRPVLVESGWLSWEGALIPGLAQTIYDEQAFDRLPIVADALEDAGCADDAILSHLRGPGPHVRGCWALDLLLGKS